jgi:DUF1365 family protein
MSKPVPESAFFAGRVMHMRLAPKRHQFRYRVFSLLLDIDALDAVANRIRLLKLDRFGLISFYRSDHGPRDGSDLRAWVDAELARIGVRAPAQVRLLSFPRILGVGFNPISVFYCYDENGTPSAVIYEVKNTFGDQVAYAMALDAQDVSHRHGAQKEMYVSPFVSLDQTYRFSMQFPGEELALRIKQGAGQADELIATHNAQRMALSDRNAVKLLMSHPMMSLKVIVAIHFEALRLFLKGVRFHRYSKSKIWAEKTPAE